MKKNNSNILLMSILIFTLLSTAVFTACKPISEEAIVNNNVNEQVEDEITEQNDEKLEEENETGPDSGETAADNADIISISVEEVYEIIKNKDDYYILDVRTEQEYYEGHIEGAALIPVQELESMLDKLPQDKPIIVYCRSGNRSRTAAEILVSNGFDMVYDMGGINDWIEKGYPVITVEK